MDDEPFGKFALGHLRRGCPACGAALQPAGHTSFIGVALLRLREQAPLATADDRFLRLACVNGCTGTALLFARDAAGRPHFWREPHV